MSRFLVPFGMIALFLSALALPSEAREDPGRKDPPKKTTAAPDKSSPRKSRMRVFLGVYTVPVEDLSSRLKKRLQLKDEEGVIVVDVMPDSPAEDAGLRHGDVITHVNGKAIADQEELSNDLNQLGVNQKVKLSILREGKKQDITAQLEEEPVDVITSIPFGRHGNGSASRSSGDKAPSSAPERLRQIERLERRISHLEKRLDDLEKSHSAKKP